MPEKVKEVNWERWLSLFAILYFMFGIVFAFVFAWYYTWPPAGYLSPGFWSVTITWPYQAIGFVNDFLYYGMQGKPV